MDNRPAKKRRVDCVPVVAGSGNGVISPQLFHVKEMSSIRGKYQAALPYPHAVLPTLCIREQLLAVRKELNQHVQGTFKETDLFKLRQSIDLANVKQGPGISHQEEALANSLSSVRRFLG